MKIHSNVEVITVENYNHKNILTTMMVTKVKLLAMLNDTSNVFDLNVTFKTSILSAFTL